ncbi:hypothetical protein ACGFYM_44265, partial [Streptomyces sp. NPDC048231]
MDLSSVIIAVAGVAGTLGGSLLTQRGSERAKRREIELVRDHEEIRENRSLRRTCYVELNRDARQFTTALNRHLHVIRERGAEDADRDALDEARVPAKLSCSPVTWGFAGGRGARTCSGPVGWR